MYMGEVVRKIQLGNVDRQWVMRSNAVQFGFEGLRTTKANSGNTKIQRVEEGRADCFVDCIATNNIL